MIPPGYLVRLGTSGASQFWFALDITREAARKRKVAVLYVPGVGKLARIPQRDLRRPLAISKPYEAAGMAKRLKRRCRLWSKSKHAYNKTATELVLDVLSKQ